MSSVGTRGWFGLQRISRWARNPSAGLAGMLVVQAALLVYSASVHCPVIDEPAHLAAGLSHWRFGEFSLYRVNPPLVRMVAAAPLLLNSIDSDWKSYSQEALERREFRVGADLVVANGTRIFQFMTIARWACIPFALVGAVVCYRWARLLFGKRAGLLAAGLWCFSPTVLGHGSLLTPDCAATALGLAACYAFFRWLIAPTFGSCILAGVMLGAAEACKSTWIILFVLFPCIWLLYRCWLARGRLQPPVAQLAVIVALGWWLLVSIYGWQGVGAPLEKVTLKSNLFRRAIGEPTSDGGYRVRQAIAKWPLPLPLDYVIGLDTQSRDLEGPNRSFLRGEWREQGWWHYYAYGLAVKEPVGALVLASLSLAWWSAMACRAKWRRQYCARRWHFLAVSGLMAIVPLAVLLIASAATGMNHHVRYVMPVVPYLYIAASGLLVRRGPWRAARRAVSFTFVVFVVISSLWVFPHSLSYFNELAGGPAGGIRHLNNSNIDWGQDLLLLREWKKKHAPNEPIYVAYFGRVNPNYAGIDYQLPPLLSRDSSSEQRRTTRQELRPGWYAISVTLLQGRGYHLPTPTSTSIVAEQEALSYFQELRPVDRVGYSIYMYHVSAMGK